MKDIFTIGHSKHPMDYFLKLLRQHSIDIVCDVRSHPFSRMFPQYNRDTLISLLRRNNFKYMFMGKELGVRSTDPENYRDGKVQYELLASTHLFQAGLDRLKKGVHTHKIALMCAEKDPIMCHRAILVCRNLKEYVGNISHILESGELEPHSALENRLLKIHKLGDDDFFMGNEDKLRIAYNLQSEIIAYEINEDDNGTK